MKPSRFALLLALSIVAFAAPASAWPYIDVTASEVLSIDPPRVRTTFDLYFAGYHPLFDPQYFEIIPLDPAALHILECGAPEPWVCGPAHSYPADVPGVYFNFHGPAASYVPINTFSIVTDQVNPCVAIDFAQLPTMEGGYRIDACLLVDAPVPTRLASWGSLKSIYR